MPPRFYASPYKNAVATIPKKDGWWSELPVSTSAASDSTNLIKASSEYWLAQGSTAGQLVCLPYEEPAKLGLKAPTVQVASKAITDFDVSRFDDLLAAGTDGGVISVHNVPALAEFTSHDATVSPSSSINLSHPATSPISTLAFHPTSSALLLAAAKDVVGIYDIPSTAPALTLSTPGSSPIWSAQWSHDGRFVSTTAKDGKLRLYDPRAGAEVVGEVVAHGGLKCSRHVSLRDGQLFSTGFSKMRDREYSLWDARDLTKAVKTNRLDTGTGVLIPVADQDRGIVYLAGRGGQTLRWVEVGGPSVLTEGGAPLGFTTAGFALAPPEKLELMKAEVNRAVVLTTEAVVPVSINVPRRQYIDFHQDLFPPVRARVAAQTAPEWIAGGDNLPDLVPQHPSRKAAPVKQAPTPAQAPVASNPTAKIPVQAPPAAAAATPTPQPVEQSTVVPAASKPEVPVEALDGLSLSSPAAVEAVKTEEPPRPSVVTAAPVFKSSAPAPAPAAAAKETAPGAAAPSPAPSSTQTPSAAAAPAPASTPASASAPSYKPPSSRAQEYGVPTTPRAPRVYGAAAAAAQVATNPDGSVHWSRSFLTGSSSLKPDYHGLSNLSVSMSAETPLLKANTKFAAFPLGGPGGRVAVHALSKKGRFAPAVPAFVSGANVTYFELDPFDEHRLYVAGDDGRVRVFRVPEGGLEEGEDVSKAEAVLEDGGVDKIGELVAHPAAKDLLLSVSDDRGKPTLRLCNVAERRVVLKVDVPAAGVSSVAWSPDGGLLAVATKDKRLLVLDPRKPDAVLSSPAHEGSRPAKVAWVSDSHLVSTSHTRGAMREIILYALSPGKELKVIGRQPLDQVPAPFFLHCDLDSNVLFLYSRGDRSCLAYEVQPEAGAGKQFTKLPAFSGGTFQSGFAFLPKKHVDVRSVELVRGLRLSPGTVEVVSWKVPRAKGEYFQDDVFVPTREVKVPRVTAGEWLAGKNGEITWLDLQPEGMKPLSQAPVAAPKPSSRNLISNEIQLTDSQRQEQYMERLFAKAKEDGDEEEVEGRGHAPVQDDDDW